MNTILRFGFIAVLLLTLLPKTNGQVNVVLKVPQPVAIVGTPNFGYFILCQDNGVFHYVPTPHGLEFKNRFDNRTPGQSFDITYVQLNGQESVFISSWSNALHMGYVNRYDSTGRLLKSWPIRKIPVGMDYDVANDFLYIATADSNEIYRIHVRNGNPEYFYEISGSTRLGSLVVDSAKQSIYVADSANGKVFHVDIRTKKVIETASGFRLLSALRFDDQSRSLYVADAVSRQISSIKVDAGAAIHPLVLTSQGLKNPSGIATGANGTLLISDVEMNAILQIAPVVNQQRKRR